MDSNKINEWLAKTTPWTNVYGLSRTLLAFSTFITLILNDTTSLFRITNDMDVHQSCVNSYSLFCLTDFTSNQLTILKWLSAIILLVVASGWRPKYTGILHAYIALSFNQGVITVDGADQAVAVFTLILLPLTLTDKRKWHWQSVEIHYSPLSKIIGLSSYYAFRIQVAILYFHSFIAKLIESEWVHGTAVWYYLQGQLYGFHEALFDFFRPLLSSAFIVIPTWGTLLIQILLFMALLMPKKYWKYVLILAIIMHEIFAVLLGLVSFSIAIIGILILYLRPVENTFQFMGARKLIKGLKNINIYKMRRTS
ncbi:hypothetical protein I7830_05275 [Mammaliicoccus sciuri]|uniref:HTTM-like domain-containing protein n=1 Tax=Mammaliicoccus lentus TaxID=42858 RepID=A0AAX3W433_MAMLE|nr:MULTISPECIES: sporulation-delaying protein SdpB family protein [Mammaliicoccus]QPW15682.1 hypothetical protein I7830_05275 [Mammaliicoccus sciuri]WHI59700.1 hypothetical protein PYH69_13445 [Mammaliicoccus lentus]